MKHYIIYNTISGEIIQLCSVVDLADISHLLVEGISQLELAKPIIDTNRYYVQANQLVIMPEQPGPYYKFDYQTKTWQDVRTEAQKFQQASREILNQRKQLLDSTDWIVVKAVDTGTPIPTAWQTYRQELRDVTNQTGYPYQVTWPTKPTN
jgi:hypothetical protein